MARVTTRSGKRRKIRGGPTHRYRSVKSSTRSSSSRPTKRRKVGGSTKKKRTTKKVTMQSGVKAHLQSFLNPFANKAGAKIPDGACLSSLPLRHHQVFEVTTGAVGGDEAGNDGPYSRNGTAHILLYPGLHGGVYWTINMPADANELENHELYATDSKLSGLLVGGTGTNQSDVLIGPGGTGSINNDGDIARWRLVSSGLKLTLLNNDESNDGWWEATRVQYKPRMTDWKLKQTGADPNFSGSTTLQVEFDNFKFLPDDNIIDMLEDKNWAESPSYMCGALKDIHKKQFNLMPYNRQTGFRELETKYNNESGFQSTQNVNSLTGPYEIDLLDGATAAKTLYEDMLDTNMDMIIIRIHPGPSSTGTFGGHMCKLLAEHACNQEVVYDVDSTLAKFMTPSVVDQKALNTAKDIKHASHLNVVAMDA